MPIKLRSQIFLVILFTGLGFFNSSAIAELASSAGSCTQLFSEAQPQALLTYVPKLARPALEPIFGQIRSSFVHTDKYTVTVDGQSDIKDQCSLGICHMAAWDSQLEHEYKARSGKSVVLSMKYQAAKYWLRRALEELAKENSTDPRQTSKLDVSLGSWPIISRSYIVEAGLIPEGVWTPKTDFMSPPTSTRMEEYIENVIGRVRLMRSQAMFEAEKDKITLAGAYEIKNIFDNVVGPVPKTFTYEGQTTNPKAFMLENFPELADPLVNMWALAPISSLKTRVNVSDLSTDVYTNVDNIEKTMRELLDQGHNVYLAYQHQAAYVDRASGVMSIAAFETPSAGAPLPSHVRNYFGKTDGGHAVQIVGYDLDPATGKVIKWKLKNSWTSKAGDQGYFHMYDDYFRTFAKGIYFSRNLGIELPVAQEHDPEQLDFNFGKK